MMSRPSFLQFLWTCPSIQLNKIITGPTALTKDQHVHTTYGHIPEVLPQKKYFLFQGKYSKQVHGAAMDSPISHLVANLVMEEFKVKALSSAPHPLPMVKVCGWHLWYPGGKTQSTITSTYQLTGPTYSVHCRGTKWRRSLTFPGHLGFSRSQQHSSYHFLQKVYTYWPTTYMWQQPLHQSKI